jgi:outer membrane protein assembly factor BamB
MRTVRGISLSVVVALMMQGVAAGQVAPTNGGAGLMVQAAQYADRTDVDAVRSNIGQMAGGSGDRRHLKALVKFYQEYRLYDEGAEVMRWVSGVSTGDVQRDALAAEVEFRFYGGDMEAASDLADRVVALAAANAWRESEIRHYKVQADQRRGIGQVLASVTVETAVGLGDEMEALRRRVEAGVAVGAGADVIRKLKATHDQVVYLEDGTGIDAAGFIWRQIAAWPEALRKAVIPAIEKEARKAASGIGEDDIEAQGGYWRRYRGVRASAEGAERIADRLLDRGAYALARAWYARARMIARRPMLEAKYAYACSRAGDAERVAALLARLTPAEKAMDFVVAGNHITLGVFIDTLPGKPAPLAALLFPDALHPAWAVPLMPVERCIVCRQLIENRRAEEPRSETVNVPLATGSVLMLNNGRRLRCFEAGTGSNVWVRSFDAGVVADPERSMPVFTLQPVPVFGVHSDGVMMVCRHAETISREERLIRSGLTAVENKTGLIRWRTRDLAEFKELHVASEPLLSDGVLYFMARRHDAVGIEVRAYALEVATGRMLWKRRLLTGLDRGGENQYRSEKLTLELPAPVATPEGIFFATQMGKLFLMDALTGEVIWLQAYGRASGDDTVSRWLVNPSLVDGKRIVVAPRDSSRIMALERTTGRILWSQPAVRESVLCGIWQGKVVTCGHDVRLRDPVTGLSCGTIELKAPPVLPMGFLRGDRLWISETNGIQKVDLAAMKESGRIQGPGRGIPSGDKVIRCLAESVSVLTGK